MLIKAIFIVLISLLFTSASFTGENLNMLLTLLSGNFSNAMHTKWFAESKNDIFMINKGLSYTPIMIPALSDAPCLLLDEYANNQLIRQEIFVLTTDQDRIIFQIYYLNSSTKIIPMPYDASNLDQLTFDDLWTRPQCTAVFDRIDQTIFYGVLYECLEDGKGKNLYLPTISCKYFVVLEFKSQDGSRNFDNLDKNEIYPIDLPQVPDYDLYASLCGY